MVGFVLRFAAPSWLSLAQRGAHRVHDLDRANANGCDPSEEIDNLLLVVSEPIGVELLADGWVLRLLLFVLVKDPFKRTAVAEPVLPSIVRDTCERRLAVDQDATGLLVGRQQHLRRRSG